MQDFGASCDVDEVLVISCAVPNFQSMEEFIVKQSAVCNYRSFLHFVNIL